MITSRDAIDPWEERRVAALVDQGTIAGRRMIGRKAKRAELWCEMGTLAAWMAAIGFCVACFAGLFYVVYVLIPMLAEAISNLLHL